MGWQRNRITRLLVSEFFLHALLGGILGVYLAVVVQILVPAQRPSCHILCSIDSLGNTLAGVGLVLFVAAVSAVSFAYCFVRLRPINNLKNA